jgi:hypothetical protein
MFVGKIRGQSRKYPAFNSKLGVRIDVEVASPRAEGCLEIVKS